MRLARLALSALVFTFGAASPLFSQAQGYAVLDLGYDLVAYGLNDKGQIAGADYSEQGGGRAFFTGVNGTGITYVDGLPEGTDASAASSINNQGQIAGTYLDPSVNSHVFVAGANGRVVQTTGVLSDGYGSIINNNGQIAGSQNGRIAVFDSQTGQTTLRGGVDDAIRFAFGFNDKGQVVGRDYSSGRGFVSNSDGSFQAIGSLGGGDSAAYAINNSGWVVGSARDANNLTHAFLAAPDSNSLIDLTPLAVFAEAVAINESGQVVGSVSDDAGERRAFITGANGQGLVDLNSLVQLGGGFVFDFAHGINNVGQIIATGSDGHGYLLTPMAIPEPGTVALWMLGLLGLGVATRRQRHTG